MAQKKDEQATVIEWISEEFDLPFNVTWILEQFLTSSMIAILRDKLVQIPIQPLFSGL